MTTVPIIRRTALQILNEAGSFALPEATLFEHLKARLRPAPTEKDFCAAIAGLKTAGQIAALPGEHGDPAPRWLITEAGQVALKQ